MPQDKLLTLYFKGISVVSGNFSRFSYVKNLNDSANLAVYETIKSFSLG